MLAIALNLSNKHVCVIGGGKVAYRKTKQFIEQKALVTVIALDFIDAFKELKINKIISSYHVKYLENMFLVYVATDNEEINKKVVNDCNELNILCGSATYNSNSSLYSMANYKNDLGLIGLSMHQKLPGCKTLLNKMAKILDDESKRITIVEKIRSLAVKKVNLSGDFFEILMNADMKIVNFIYQSWINGKGIIFIYHHSCLSQSITLEVEHSICLTISEFIEVKKLFLKPVAYTIFPLLLSEGSIYQKIKQNVDASLKLLKPLITSKDDIKLIVDIFNNPQKEMIYIIHPKSDMTLKNSLKMMVGLNGTVYDDNEPLQLSLNKEYHIVFLLMTKGTHYQKYLDQIENYRLKGYKITFSEPLLYNDKIKNEIKKRL